MKRRAVHSRISHAHCTLSVRRKPRLSAAYHLPLSGASAEAVLNTLPVEICALDRHGTIIKASNAWLCSRCIDILSSGRFTIGANFVAICNQAAASGSIQAGGATASVTRVLRGKVRRSAFEYLIDFGAERRWYRLEAMRLADRRLRQIVLVNVDVTSQKAATEDLKETVMSVGCLIWHALVTESHGALDWEMTLVNEEAVKSYFPVTHKWEKRYLKAWYAGIKGATQAEMHKRAVDAIRSGAPGYSQEYERELANGDIRTMSEQVRIEPMGPGKWQLVGVCADITERVRAERQVEQSEALYHTLADTIPQLVWMSGPDGVVDFCNQRCYEYTGLLNDLHPHLAWPNVVHPDDYARTRIAWDNACATGQPYEIELRLRDGNGDYRWFLNRAMPLRTQEGSIIRWFGTCTDIDAHKHAAASKQFLTELSHQMQSEFASADVARGMVQRVAGFLNADICNFSTVTGGSYSYSTLHDKGLQITVSLPGADTLAMQAGGLFVSNDINADPRIPDHCLDILRQNRIRAIMVAPVVKAGRCMASMITAMCETARQWRPDEVKLLEEIAEQTWLAVENSRLYQAARDEITEREKAELQMQQAHAEMADVLESMTDGFILLDHDWIYTYVNRAAEQIAGNARESMLSHSFWTNPPFTISAEMEQSCQSAMAQRSASSCTAFDPASERWYEVRLYPWYGGLAVYYQDVTESKVASDALRESEARFRQLAENIDAIFWLKSSSAQLYVSPAYERIWGRSIDEIIADPDSWITTIHPDDRELVAVAMEDMEKAFDITYRIVRPDGAIRWIRDRGFPIPASSESEMRAAGIAQDITQVVEAEELVKWQAYHDALTRLPNRTLFNLKLNAAITSAEITGAEVAVLYVDIDGFKFVNDSLGHDAGDEALCQIAARLEGATQGTGMLARLGGDEFGILMQDTAGTDAPQGLARAIAASLADPIPVAQEEIPLTASIGISAYPRDGCDARTILKNADMTMYRVKAEGKNGYQVYSTVVSTEALERLAIADCLHRAMEASEMFLAYQPQTDIITGEIVGVEALLRWKHPQLGMVPPERFIPVAEESGAIGPIGEWAILQACRQAAEWQCRGYPVRVAVNVSPHQLQRQGFVEFIGATLQQVSLDPGLLEIEITESALIDTALTASGLLMQLSRLGVSISVDDFGTGYSSLAYLSRLPINVLKADRSFVHGIATNVRDTAVIKAVIELARSLGLRVVAEGVETQEQRNCLLSMGCRVMQGFLLSHPVSAQQVTALLASGVNHNSH